MVTSNIKAVLPCEIHRVWETVTAVEGYSWRGDLSKTEVLDENRFVEYTKDGYPTYFTVTKMVPPYCLEFDMENSNMRGHWTGRFVPKGDETAVDFTEQVTAKKFFLRPFVKRYLQKQQAQFIADLKAHLDKMPGRR